MSIMKVVILGCGAVGSVLANLLAKEKDIKEIIFGDIVQRKKFHNKKIKFFKIDITKKNHFHNFLIKINPDIVINASLPKFNLKIMEACLKAKVNYLDTAAYWNLDPNPKAKIPYKMEQMDYNDKFKKANLTGLIEAGVAPGFDNLMTAECASKLDEIDYIKIRMVEDTGSKEIFFSWNKEWLLDELNWKPLVYENGKFRIEKSFGAEEEYEFPKPIGKKKTYYFAQDEVGSIPLYIKTKKLDVKIHDNNIEASKMMVALGFTSEKSINIDNVEVKPIKVLSKLLPDPVPGEEKKFPNAIFAMCVEAIGKYKRKKKRIKFSIVFPTQKEINKLGLDANFISYPTALSVKHFVMAFPKIKKKGVFPPECLDNEVRKDILKEIKKNKLIHLKISSFN